MPRRVESRLTFSATALTAAAPVVVSNTTNCLAEESSRASQRSRVRSGTDFIRGARTDGESAGAPVVTSSGGVVVSGVGGKPGTFGGGATDSVAGSVVATLASDFAGVGPPWSGGAIVACSTRIQTHPRCTRQSPEG
ncbi:hypothetical protein ACFL5O_10615 [Myxococcota bacterium]